MELSQEQATLLRRLDEAADAGHASGGGGLPPSGVVALQLVVDMAALDDPVKAFLSLEPWLQRWVAVRRRYGAIALPSPGEAELSRLALETVSRQLKASHERLALLAREHFFGHPASD